MEKHIPEAERFTTRITGVNDPVKDPVKCANSKEDYDYEYTMDTYEESTQAGVRHHDV